MILVDPGPAATIPVLKSALKKQEIKHIDYILLTHIHIDHAGGTGLLLEDFPEARVICHPKGIKHMIEPDKLWEGSLKVLGKIAKAYGPIASIPEKSISFPDLIEDNELNVKIIETPGHASHHVNYLVDNILFAGEVAGVNVPNDYGFYLRIATPPRFIYEIYKNSLDKASELPCKTICFGHYDLSNDPDFIFQNAKEQLELWFKLCSEMAKEIDPSPENIFKILLTKDICLKYFNRLDEDIQYRERYFALNSINGMLGYFMDQK